MALRRVKKNMTHPKTGKKYKQSFYVSDDEPTPAPAPNVPNLPLGDPSAAGSQKSADSWDHAVKKWEAFKDTENADAESPTYRPGRARKVNIEHPANRWWSSPNFDYPPSDDHLDNLARPLDRRDDETE